MRMPWEWSPSDDPVRDLLDALDELVGLLREHGDSHWADWMEADRHRLAAGEMRAAKHVLDAYGGMGSINDVTWVPNAGAPPHEVYLHFEVLAQRVARCAWRVLVAIDPQHQPRSR